MKLNNKDSKQKNDIPKSLRTSSEVMRLERLGSFHQCRLSFIRHLLRKLQNYKWQFDRPIWNINKKGFGYATYRAIGPERNYTLIVFSHYLPKNKRSDRVIAEAWDASFTLFDGEPTKKDITRLSKNIPLQEAGRISQKEIVLSRANRSVRLFDYVVDTLAEGKQPDIKEIEDVGYLMRTTAVYGSGKFGATDREKWSNRNEFSGSFQPELLSVWLIRSFTLDLVEHLAQIKSPKNSVKVNSDLRRVFGVGNSTGLGMAPFLINHPSLIHSWINAREQALLRLRSIKKSDPKTLSFFKNLLLRAKTNTQQWNVNDRFQTKKILELKRDLDLTIKYISQSKLKVNYPWNKIYLWCEKNLNLEGQEQIISLIIDANGNKTDDLSKTMSANEDKNFKINGLMKIKNLKNIIENNYAWALSLDYSKHNNRARVWYISQEKLEPRLGERFEEPIEDYEQPLAPGYDLSLAAKDLSKWSEKKTVAEFLIKHPEHRHIIRRVQMTSSMKFAEIQDNTISSSMLPIDLLRCKLSFFGATKFDPRSDRWVRITMFQGYPFPEELHGADIDDMAYPPIQF